MTTIKGNEIKANMTLTIEYGREGNFVDVTVTEVEPVAHSDFNNSTISGASFGTMSAPSARLPPL